MTDRLCESAEVEKKVEGQLEGPPAVRFLTYSKSGEDEPWWLLDKALRLNPENEGLSLISNPDKVGFSWTINPDGSAKLDLWESPWGNRVFEDSRASKGVRFGEYVPCDLRYTRFSVSSKGEVVGVDQAVISVAEADKFPGESEKIARMRQMIDGSLVEGGLGEKVERFVLDDKELRRRLPLIAGKSLTPEQATAWLGRIKPDSEAIKSLIKRLNKGDVQVNPLEYIRYQAKIKIRDFLHG